MPISNNGIALVQQSESCSLVAYKDPIGIWTIGFGHIKDVKQGDTCTYSQAIEWLKQDTEEAESYVNDLVKVSLNQNELDALIDFVFNLGPTNFKNSTLLRLINEGNKLAAAQQFERWNKAGGKVLSGLTKRRLAEKALFLQ